MSHRTNAKAKPALQSTCNNTGPLASNCVKFQGTDLGVDGSKTVNINGTDVTIQLSMWIAKAGEPTQYVCFDYMLTTSGTILCGSVKAGTMSYPVDPLNDQFMV